MFTWVCPDCGYDVDVAAEQCPRCSGQLEGKDEQSQATAVRPQPPPAEPPAAPARQVSSPEPEPRQRLPTGPARAPQPIEATRPSGGLQFRARHLVYFMMALAVALSAAFWLATGSVPGLSSLRLELPGEMELSPVETFAMGVQGPIEVSGIRPYYTDEFQARVRAFVANHAKSQQPVAVRVHLRVREAGQQVPPLASFAVVLSAPLPPNGGQEVDVELEAMGSLQSLPPWEEMRVDLESINE